MVGWIRAGVALLTLMITTPAWAQSPETDEANTLSAHAKWVKRDGDTLRFYNQRRAIGELNTATTPPDKRFVGMTRLKAKRRLALPTVTFRDTENRDDLIIDRDGVAWWIPNGGVVSPNGRYLLSLTPAMNGAGWYIVDWPTKTVHFFPVNCDEGEWVSKREIRLICRDFIWRDYMTYVEARALRQADGNWLLMQTRAVQQAPRTRPEDPVGWVTRDIDGYFPIAKFSDAPFPLKPYDGKDYTRLNTGP